MRYRAYFSYYLQSEDDSYKNKNFSIPIQSFEVEGGIKQFIAVNDVDTEASVELELEQARVHNNINLYLYADDRHQMMMAAVDLGAFAAQNLTFSAMIIVQRFAKKKMVTGFGLMDLTTELDSAPNALSSGLLHCKLKLSEPKLLHGYTGKYYLEKGYEVL